MMKLLSLNLILLFISLQIFAQTGQLTISRISQMPDLLSPLLIRDWKTVAHDYDSFVFDFNKTGLYLPLSRLGTTGQFNYSDNTPLYLDSYVGTDSHLNQAEAINIIPAIVGASLTGIDKSNQNGTNWVAMTKDFFNLKNGQNVYLNSYSTTLDSFKAFSGTIQPSIKPLTIGRMDNVETLYSLRGSIDEVKLWDREIPIRQIEKLKDQWNTSFGIEEDNVIARIYPNPAVNLISIELSKGIHAKQLSLFNEQGKEIVNNQVNLNVSTININIPPTSPGIHFLRIILDDAQIIRRGIILL